VGIGEDHPGFRQGIEVGRRNFAALGIEALHIPVAEIVAEEDDDVRPFLSPTLVRWSNRKGAGSQGKERG
jgi:hypothetical protein